MEEPLAIYRSGRLVRLTGAPPRQPRLLGPLEQGREPCGVVEVGVDLHAEIEATKPASIGGRVTCLYIRDFNPGSEGVTILCGTGVFPAKQGCESTTETLRPTQDSKARGTRHEVAPLMPVASFPSS